MKEETVKQLSVVLLSSYALKADLSGSLIDQLTRRSNPEKNKYFTSVPTKKVDAYFQPYLEDQSWLQDTGRQIKHHNRGANYYIRTTNALDLGVKLVNAMKAELTDGRTAAFLFFGYGVNEKIRLQVGQKLDPLRYPPTLILPANSYFDFKKQDPFSGFPGRLVYASEKNRGLFDANLFFEKEIEEIIAPTARKELLSA